MTSPVIYHQEGVVVTLTLNEPDTRNAISPAIVEALVAACTRINMDMSVGCVVLTGAGKGFSSGGNVKEMRDKTGLFGGTPVESCHPGPAKPVGGWSASCSSQPHQAVFVTP